MPRISIPGGDDVIQRRMLAAHQPAYLQSWTDMAEAIYENSILPFRLRELLRYRIALINGCMICQSARVVVEGEAPVDPALYDNVAAWRTSGLYTDAETLAFDYAERFSADHHTLDADFFQRLHQHFTEAEIVDLAFVVARHMAFGRMTHVLGLDDSCDTAPSAPARALAEMRA